ncbi:MAG: RNA polymerase sigma-70 factor [Tannerella sp.]|jgi:RNA polymerase sigma-70 factor (ECF subfamily)|nr:RNA polymerase sigma-70 factor [Tannerella sp.]
MHGMESDTDLFISVQKGDKKAFDAFFRRYYPALCAYAVRFVEFDDAEEIIQDLMLWLWESRDNIIVGSSIGSYLFRAVRNKCINHIHKTQLHEQIHESILNYLQEQFEDPDFYVVEELLHKIEEVLWRLPETYREAFVLSRFEGKTYSEIAVHLGVSPKTIDYRIQQALKKLRTELKDFLPLIIPLFSL